MEESDQQRGFFVGINNPIDVRRNTLECSREMVKILQSHEKIRVIREEKLKRMQQLKTVIRELDLLVSKMRNELPTTHLRAGMVEPRPAKDFLLRKQVKARDSAGEIEQLEQQLADLEHEISRLG